MTQVITKTRTFRILSIDAWADCCGCDHTDESEERCWTWNEWHSIGHAEQLPESLEDAFKALSEAGYVDLPTALSRAAEFEIEDDGYNVVVLDKESQRPLYAFEYGNED